MIYPIKFVASLYLNISLNIHLQKHLLKHLEILNKIILILSFPIDPLHGDLSRKAVIQQLAVDGPGAQLLDLR